MSDFNDKIIAEFRANKGRVETGGFGDSLLLLHTIGAKSGTERVTPAMAIPVDDGWLVAASKAGAPDHPAWYRNLKTHPEIRVETGDGTVEVTAVELEANERDAAWQRFVAKSDAFADYQRKAGDRLIPVVELRRR